MVVLGRSTRDFSPRSPNLRASLFWVRHAIDGNSENTLTLLGPKNEQPKTREKLKETIRFLQTLTSFTLGQVNTPGGLELQPELAVGDLVNDGLV